MSSTSKRSVPNGIILWAAPLPLTCRVICCSGWSPIELQADRLGDLDPQTKRALDALGSTDKARQNDAIPARHDTEVKAGTILGREWNGRMHRVSVLADGFAYNGETYSSLSKIASLITGTRWNGPKFFGLRDKLAGPRL